MPTPAVFWVLHLDGSMAPMLPEACVDSIQAEEINASLYGLPDPDRMLRLTTLTGARLTVRAEAVVALEESTPASRAWQEERQTEARRREDWGT